MIIDPKKLIINRYEKQTTGHRTIAVVLLILFWGALFYLMRPLFIIVGWFLAYFVFDNVLASLHLQDALTVVFTRYLPAVLIISFSLWAWAAYNRRRFSGNRDKRRVPNPPATLEQIAESAPYLTLHQIENMRAAKALVCYYDNQGEVYGVDCCRTLNGIDDALTRAATGQHVPPTLAETEYADFEPTLKEPPAEMKKRFWPRLFAEGRPGNTAVLPDTGAQPPQPLLREPIMPLSEAVNKALADLSPVAESGRLPDDSLPPPALSLSAELELCCVSDITPEPVQEPPRLSSDQPENDGLVRPDDNGPFEYHAARRPVLGRRAARRRQAAFGGPRKSALKI